MGNNAGVLRDSHSMMTTKSDVQSMTTKQRSRQQS